VTQIVECIKIALFISLCYEFQINENDINKWKECISMMRLQLSILYSKKRLLLEYLEKEPTQKEYNETNTKKDPIQKQYNETNNKKDQTE
jgi:hypothetical protein